MNSEEQKRKIKIRESKFGFAFCAMRIIVDLTAGVIGTSVFVSYFFKMASTGSTFAVCILIFLACIFILAADIHSITRDIRHIRETDPRRNERKEEAKKIEF